MSHCSRICVLLACLFGAALVAPAVRAHKVTIFATVDSNMVKGEAFFSGDRPAKDSEVLVENGADGRVLMKLHTDANGQFSFQIPAEAIQSRLDLRLVLIAGQGHRNEWLIKADEYVQPDTAHTTPAPQTEAVERSAPKNGPGALNIMAGLASIAALFGLLAWSKKRQKGEKK